MAVEDLAPQDDQDEDDLEFGGGGEDLSVRK
jgi:hypothetical protein